MPREAYHARAPRNNNKNRKSARTPRTHITTERVSRARLFYLTSFTEGENFYHSALSPPLSPSLPPSLSPSLSLPLPLSLSFSLPVSLSPSLSPSLTYDRGYRTCTASIITMKLFLLIKLMIETRITISRSVSFGDLSDI